MIYIIQYGHTNLVKVGRTTSLSRRLANLQSGSPEKLTVLQSWETGETADYIIEGILHRLLDSRAHCLEWFRFSVRDLRYIKQANTIADLIKYLRRI